MEDLNVGSLIPWRQSHFHKYRKRMDHEPEGRDSVNMKTFCLQDTGSHAGF